MAEAAEMPVKPRIPATTDTRKKISAHFSSVMVRSSSFPRDAGLTSGAGTGSVSRRAYPTHGTQINPAARDWLMIWPC